MKFQARLQREVYEPPPQARPLDPKRLELRGKPRKRRISLRIFIFILVRAPRLHFFYALVNVFCYVEVMKSVLEEVLHFQNTSFEKKGPGFLKICLQITFIKIFIQTRLTLLLP